MPMLLPPSQYDHPPQIPVIEKVLPWNELQRLCRASERPIYNGTMAASGSVSARPGRSSTPGADGTNGARGGGRRSNG